MQEIADLVDALGECPVGHDGCRTRVLDRVRTVATVAEGLERLKHDLVSTVNHELRTPLANILGYCELLTEDDDLDPATRAMVDVIHRNSNRLVSLISDLLLLADLDSRAEVAPWLQVDMAEVVQAVARRVEEPATAAGMRLELQAPPPGPVVMGQRDQLERAVQHLAANAVKFAGGVARTLSMRVRREGEDVVVEVIDDGMGFAPEDLPQLVDRFGRADQVRDQQVQGAGIGLSVVSSVADHHGGELRLDAGLGRGTAARLVLPAVDVSRAPAGGRSRQDPRQDSPEAGSSTAPNVSTSDP